MASLLKQVEVRLGLFKTHHLFSAEFGISRNRSFSEIRHAATSIVDEPTADMFVKSEVGKMSN